MDSKKIVPELGFAWEVLATPHVIGATIKGVNLQLPVSYAMPEWVHYWLVNVEAGRRQGPRPTREAIAAALDGIQALDLGGYVVAFRPDMQNGSRFVELTIVSSTGRTRQ
jgi:branched-chain amino acid transport system substrate-binding protein